MHYLRLRNCISVSRHLAPLFLSASLPSVSQHTYNHSNWIMLFHVVLSAKNFILLSSLSIHLNCFSKLSIEVKHTNRKVHKSWKHNSANFHKWTRVLNQCSFPSLGESSSALQGSFCWGPLTLLGRPVTTPLRLSLPYSLCPGYGNPQGTPFPGEGRSLASALLRLPIMAFVFPLWVLLADLVAINYC